MLRTQDIQIKQLNEGETRISHLSPQGLLPAGQTLVINFETRTISLLSDGPTLIVEQQLSANEMHLLVPILDYFPHYCPYEVFLSYLSTKVVTEASIERFRQRLREAQACGRWQQELRPVRRALSSLRNKLYRLDLGISNVRERGCGLISLTAKFATHLEVNH
jgi:hypothetical protein